MSADNTLDKDTVHKIAKLARLELSDADTEKYQKDLSRILALAEQMQQCDTEGVDVMTHPMDAILRLREDTVTEADNRSEFQKIAPNTEKGLYLVPKVID
ncbi:MAG: Asp-tRNA(Asn)/Glu-tRNA(Gln) amidotransferase subunit GatC [Arenicella sp.]